MTKASSQRIVAADERQILRQTLRDEHPVKGIAVVKEKLRELRRMSNRHSQHFKTAALQLFRDELSERFRQWQFADAVFDGDLRATVMAAHRSGRSAPARRNPPGSWRWLVAVCKDFAADVVAVG